MSQLGGALALVPRLPRPRPRSRARGGGRCRGPAPPARVGDGTSTGCDRRAMPPRHRGDPGERSRGDGGGDEGRISLPNRDGDDPARVGARRGRIPRGRDRRARARSRTLIRDRRPHGRPLLPRLAGRRIHARWPPRRGLGCRRRRSLPGRRPAAGSSSRATSSDSPESCSCTSAATTRPRRACRMRSLWRAARARPHSNCAQR